jgi:hypothetical protein
MSKLSAKTTAPHLTNLIAAYDHLGHVRVRVRGAVLTLESGPEEDPVPHARFRRDTVYLWLLEMPLRGSRWDRTGMRDTIDNLLETLTTMFPWMLEPIAENPERTSDP